MGLPIENQTLPEDKLNLTPYEQKAIVAFMRSLDDTTSYNRLVVNKALPVPRRK